MKAFPRDFNFFEGSEGRSKGGIIEDAGRRMSRWGYRKKRLVGMEKGPRTQFLS